MSSFLIAFWSISIFYLPYISATTADHYLKIGFWMSLALILLVFLSFKINEKEYRLVPKMIQDVGRWFFLALVLYTAVVTANNIALVYLCFYFIVIYFGLRSK